jgi:AcrR family transcriptional regulator
MVWRAMGWSAAGKRERERGHEGAGASEGLRERKKRLMRQELSEMATAMFLERGFENLRMREVAEICGVSEKTLYNYFPTKEALILDRWQTTPTALLDRLADPTVTPLDAAQQVLEDELGRLASWLETQRDAALARAQIRRFGDLVRDSPALRAYEMEMTNQLVSQVAQALATRIHMHPDEPEPQIAAAGIIQLWTIQFASLRKHLDADLTPLQLHAAVRADVRRAARLIGEGLAGFDALAAPTRAPASASRA